MYASLQLGYLISKVLDRGVIELIGPYGLTTGLQTSSKDIANLDTGNLTSYALYFMMSLLLLTLFLFSPTLLSLVDITSQSLSRLLLVYLSVLILLPFISFPTQASSH